MRSRGRQGEVSANNNQPERDPNSKSIERKNPKEKEKSNSTRKAKESELTIGKGRRGKRERPQKRSRIKKTGRPARKCEKLSGIRYSNLKGQSLTTCSEEKGG